MQKSTCQTIDIDEIESIEEIKFNGYVYDLNCEFPNLYISNDFISHNCILWIDEIEKGLSGMSSSGASDSGVTSRVMSTFLTWMQEKEAPVFVVATANDVMKIPPEFLRAGRFDEIFFIDLPGHEAREQIIKVIINRKNRNYKDFNITRIADASKDYSGAEIEKSIDCALFSGFEDSGRDITTQDIINGLKSFFPLSKGRKDEFHDVREHMKSYSVIANTCDKESKKKRVAKRQKQIKNFDIDIDTE